MAGTSAGAKKGWAGRTRKGGGGPKGLKVAPGAVRIKLSGIKHKKALKSTNLLTRLKAQSSSRNM